MLLRSPPIPHCIDESQRLGVKQPSAGTQTQVLGALGVKKALSFYQDAACLALQGAFWSAQTLDAAWTRSGDREGPTATPRRSVLALLGACCPRGGWN